MLLVAGVVFVLMATWKQGRDLLSAQVREDSIELPAFLDAVPQVLEVSIGHALIGEALHDGLDATVRAYRRIIDAVAAA